MRRTPGQTWTLPGAVLAENTHPFENPSLRTDDPLGLLGSTS
jgi:hypothetical protein